MPDIYQFPYGSDNYCVLVHDSVSGEAICIDAGEHQAVLDALKHTGWSLSAIWLTHHHGDHIAGVPTLKQQTGCKVYGPAGIDTVDHVLSDGDTFAFGAQSIQVIHTPGHTLDMLNYYLPSDGIVFTGDTLFVGGCGRLFEGTAEQMFESFRKLDALPEDTTIYCAHEYTTANLAFATAQSPDDTFLSEFAEQMKAKRRADEPTVPSTLKVERLINPFLRAKDAQEFARLRAAKDSF